MLSDQQIYQFLFAPGTSEDRVMEVALDAGADDVITGEDGVIEVTSEPGDFAALMAALEAAGLKPEVADVIMKPLNEIELQGDEGARMQKLLDAVEELDDVQQLYTNAVVGEA